MRDCRCHRHVRSSRPLQPAKFILWLCSLSWIGLLSADEFPQTLPRTAEWTLEKPVDEVMLDGLHRYGLRALVDAREKRQADWLKTASNVRQRIEEQQARRDRFRKLIGAVDLRITESRAGQAADRAAVPGLLESDHYFEVITHPTESPMIARSANAVVYRVRWPVLDGVSAEGLMFVPSSIRAAVVAIPDADLNPEVFAGLSPHGEPAVASGLVKSLVESGCLTIVPLLMSRSDEFSGRADIRMTNQPHREYVTRQAFEAGRHVIGYEVQKILAAVDLLEQEFVCHPDPLTSQNKPIGVIGIGEGGLLALYAAALDTRIQCCCVSGYFQTRENVWEEPIYRNVWKLLTEFGDAELGALICPRKLVIEACRISEVSGPPVLRHRRVPAAAPGVIRTCPLASVQTEYERCARYYEVANCRTQLVLAISSSSNADQPAVPGALNAEFGDGLGLPGSSAAMNAFLKGLQLQTEQMHAQIQWLQQSRISWSEIERQQFEEMQAHVQQLILDSYQLRFTIFQTPIPNVSPDVLVKRHRDWVHEELIGRLSEPRVPLNPRSRLLLRTEQYVGYEIAIDVYDDLIASGILLLPPMQPGERRPVVVCQHGLEGTPMDTISREPDAYRIYKAFAEELVRQGFIVYCPQNPYRGGDRFRVLQRMSNPLGRTLFTYIIAQHQQTLDWLVSNPQVDPKRIAFYGISYGGKTAMRVPPFVGRYSAVICSGDFTDWPRAIASNSDPCSYLFTGEYEIPEWNLAHMASYAELAMLIAPRPFMVEAGRQDSGQPPDWVEREFLKVREYYNGQQIGDRAEIEFFDGPHTIHGVGTYKFLRRHLN